MKQILILFSLLVTTFSFSQTNGMAVSNVTAEEALSDTVNSKDVQIIHADKLKFFTDKNGNPIRKLIGKVQLKQDSTFLFCDSAFLLKETNMVDMFGHVRITDGDSVEATSNNLNYDGNKKLAKLIGDASLTNSNMIISSEVLYYDKNRGVGYYLSNGKLINGTTVLTSEKAYYYSSSKDAFFNGNVHLEDPKYQLDSDTLVYNIDTEISKFYGNTRIYNEESTITCNNGTYNTKRQVATFGYGTTITNEPQVLHADSLYYEKESGYGKAMKAFTWYDKEMKVGMTGTDAEYFEKEKQIISINRPILETEIEEDTLFLRGDTVKATNSTSKVFNSYGNVRIFKDDLQAVCDSMYYNQSDSMLRLFKKPILWNEESEMKADSIFVIMKKGKIDKIEFVNNSFILTQSKGKLFDQIKGKFITAYFKNTTLQKMYVNKNAESLYFGKDDDENYMGGNKSDANRMWIYIKNDKVNKIVFLDKPEAVFTPLSQMLNTELYLKDFHTNFELKPKSKEDL